VTNEALEEEIIPIMTEFKVRGVYACRGISSPCSRKSRRVWNVQRSYR
jgi:hypothetical protein